MKLNASLFLGLLFAVLVRPAPAGDDAEFKPEGNVKPGLLHGSASDGLAPALKFNGSLRYDLGLDLRDDVSMLLESRGAVASDARANSENLYAAFHFGYSHTFYDWNNTGDVPAPGERRGRPLPGIEPAGPSGLLDVFFKTRFETDQPFNNYNVTYGPHLGFSPGAQSAWTYLIPSSCYVDYQRVEILHSVRNQQLGITDQTFWRFDASAGWYYPVGSQLASDITWLRPIDTQLDFHYYRAFDLPAGARQAGLDDAFYYAGTLGYNLRSLNPDRPSSFARFVPYVFLSVGHGRLPPSTRDQTMIYLGIVYGNAH